MRNRLLAWLVFLVTVSCAVSASAQTPQDASGERGSFAGAVYVMTNAADGNAVMVFDRLADGQLVPARTVSTGGAGTGAGLGSQSGLVLSRNERWLLAVNAGSDSISVLEVRRRGLRLVDVQPSGGTRPISITENHGVVFVLNAGSDNISGFTLGRDGHVVPIDGSTRSLSGAGTDAPQVAFSVDGNTLVVTEKATNKIDTFVVNREGVADGPRVQDSHGTTPFGFAFGKRDQLFVSEAFGGAENASATSSYEIDDQGAITTISGSIGTNQTAACWVVLTPDGRFAYASNTGSGSISGYAVDFNGGIELLDANGQTGVTGDGSSPTDLALIDTGQFLYSLNGGTGTIGAFRVRSNGSLIPLPFASGLPAGATGLAAR